MSGDDKPTEILPGQTWKFPVFDDTASAIMTVTKVEDKVAYGAEGRTPAAVSTVRLLTYGEFLGLDCVCTFEEPTRKSLITSGTQSKYAFYLDSWEDESVIHPQCPYHGENGTMVTKITVLKPPRAQRVTIYIDKEQLDAGRSTERRKSK